MNKKAVFVGINYPGTDHALRGCVNDVLMMEDLLTNHFGFTDSRNKRTLVDSAATTQNILMSLEWLVADTKPGDVLFFHYSGHGSQIYNQNPLQDSERNGFDEMLCPIDLDWDTKLIRDDDLKRIFDKVPEGVNLTVILDCCHSGGGIDSTYRYQPLGEAVSDVDNFGKDFTNRSLPMPETMLKMVPMTRSRNVIQQQINHNNQRGLLVSGCQANQTSADAWIIDKYCGAATFVLIEAIQQHNYQISYKDIVDLMNGKLAYANYTQRPELNGNPNLFDGNFLEPIV